jgi:hypothetical protein
MDGATIKRLASDPVAFRNSLVIDADGGPRYFGACLDDWQRADFSALDPAWKRVCGQESTAGRQRTYLERPRGHSKTSDLAVMVTWALFASTRRLSGVAAAADRDQAKLLRDAVDKLVSANPWLRNALEVQNFKVVNHRTGSELAIIASDAASSYGLTPDFVLIDELTHWPIRDLWDSLISAAAKRSHCLVVVISNAGYGDSWQWKTREAIRTDPDWYFSRLDGPVASWILKKHLDEQRRLLPPLVFDRLWLNRWSPGAGDALREDDIQAALSLEGPLAAAERGWRYVAGLDIGLSRDASALALVGVHVGYSEPRPAPKPPPVDSMAEMLWDCGLLDKRPNENIDGASSDSVYHEYHPGSARVKLAGLHVWQPPKGGKVSLEEIEKTFLDLHARFSCPLALDPWQGAYLFERMTKAGIRCESTDPTPVNLRGMATATLEAFSERLLALYPHERLLGDLRALRCEERQYGVRLTSPRGPSGHGDAATALSIALHAAKRHAAMPFYDRPLLAEAVSF